MKRRRTFAVGRFTARTREIEFVKPRPAPLRGPWALKAVVCESPRPVLALVRS